MEKPDLDALYSETQSKGLIEPSEIKETSSVDLDALYNQSKKEGLIENVQESVTSTRKPGLIERGLDKAFPGFSDAMAYNESRVPNLLGGMKTMGQMGQAVMLGNAAGAIPAVSKLPLAGNLAVQGAAGAQAFDYQSPVDRLLATTGSAGIGAGLGAVGSLAKSIKFGNEKQFRQMAEQLKGDLGKVDASFNGEYKAIMDKAGSRPVFQELKNKIAQSATKSIEKGVNEKYIEGIVKKMENPQLTMQELHNMKPDIYAAMRAERGGARSGIKDIYDSVNDALSDKGMGGKAYDTVRLRYDSYKKQSESYVKDLITDAKKNLTETKLKNMRSMSTNQRNALLQLSNLAKSKDLAPELQALIRGSGILRFIQNKAPLGGVGLGLGGVGLGYALFKNKKK